MYRFLFGLAFVVAGLAFCSPTFAQETGVSGVFGPSGGMEIEGDWCWHCCVGCWFRYRPESVVRLAKAIARQPEVASQVQGAGIIFAALIEGCCFRCDSALPRVLVGGSLPSLR